MNISLEASNSSTELKPGVYRHYKGGKYLVYEVGTHTESNERLVVYRPLYGSFGLSIRPLAMFLDMLSADRFEDKVSRPRFQYLGAAGQDSTAGHNKMPELDSTSHLTPR